MDVHHILVLQSSHATHPPFHSGHRCIQLKLGEPDPRAVTDTWDQFFNRLLEDILASFKRRVEQYEEELRAQMSNRMQQDWDCIAYFQCKVRVLKAGSARGTLPPFMKRRACVY